MEECRLNRRGSTIGWQDRTMYVDAHLRGDLEEFEWQDLAIRHDDKIITVICSDIIEELLVFTDLHGLKNRNIARKCEFLDWTWLHDLVTTERLVRIGHDEGDLELRIRGERIENGRS